MASRFGAAMDVEMLGRGDHLGPLGVWPLHPLDEGDAHPRGEERILAIGFLPAAPARIAADVAVVRPGVEPGADPAIASRHARPPLQPAYLGADRAGDLLYQRQAGGGPCRG